MYDKIMQMDSVVEFFRSLDNQDFRRFTRLLDFAVSTAEAHRVESKWVKKYSGLPLGYNSQPAIIFARLHPFGTAIAGTRLFVTPLFATDIYPLTIAISNAHRPAGLPEEWIIEGQRSFRPLDLDHFLDEPGNYFSGAADHGR